MKLKPCFSCGSEVRWCGDNNPDPEDDHICHQIRCDNCGIQFDVDKGKEFDSIEELNELKELVANAWNKRI